VFPIVVKVTLFVNRGGFKAMTIRIVRDPIEKLRARKYNVRVTLMKYLIGYHFHLTSRNWLIVNT
jgi:hypothetical protein